MAGRGKNKSRNQVGRQNSSPNAAWFDGRKRKSKGLLKAQKQSRRKNR